MKRGYGWALVVGAMWTLVTGGGCAEAEVLSPLPIGGSSSSSGTGVGGGGGGGGGEGPVRRTIIVRDPMGNVQKTNNLLWDGDFEWQLSFSEQYGWLYGPSVDTIGFDLPPAVMGAACHSGVKCVRLPSGAVLLGITLASEGHSLATSLWAAPQDGQCAAVKVLMISAATGAGAVSIPAATATADEGGWCHYEAVVPERHSAQYLYVENKGKDTIVDDGVVEPVTAAAKQVKALSLVKDQQKLAKLRQWVRAASWPRLPPASKAEKRFRAQLRKRWGTR